MFVPLRVTFFFGWVNFLPPPSETFQGHIVNQIPWFQLSSFQSQVFHKMCHFDYNALNLYCVGNTGCVVKNCIFFFCFFTVSKSNLFLLSQQVTQCLLCTVREKIKQPQSGINLNIHLVRWWILATGLQNALKRYPLGAYWIWTVCLFPSLK